MPKPKNNPKIIAIAAPVTITAAEGEGESGPPSFDVVAYTGGLMDLDGWDAPVVVDLKGISFSKSLVANLDHDGSKRVGHVTATDKADGQLTLSGKVSAATDAAREVVESAAKGFIWQASIEANPDELREVAAGKSVKVNGQEFTGPLYVAARSTLCGFAFVSHGADENTSVSIAAKAAELKEPNMDPKIKAWAEGMGVDVDNATPEQIAGIEANYAGQNKKLAAVDPPTDIFAQRKASAARVRGIREVAETFLNLRRNTEEDIDAIEKMTDHAIESSMSVEAFRLAMWEACSDLPQSHTVTTRKEQPKISERILMAAVCESGNLNGIGKAFTDQELQAAHDRYKSGIGLKQLYREVAELNGYTGRDYDVTAEMNRYAMGGVPQPRIRAAGEFSTISIPGILSNVANKFLLEGWGSGEMVWENITAIESVQDFKQRSSYKLNGYLKYAKVGPSGEITHGTIGEETYTNQADTYGRMLALTRTDIINDDLGAITKVPYELGVGGNDAFNDVFWTEFLSADATFFDAGNLNVSAGTVTSATVIATLIAAELVFATQTKPNGTPLGQLPDRILCPPAQKRIFMAAMNSTLVVGDTGPIPSANTFAGNYEVHSSSYLIDQTKTGWSAVKWYLLINPARTPVISTAFLNGRRAPIIETGEATSFNTLGVQMRAYHDFGVNLQEPRGGVQGTGA